MHIQTQAVNISFLKKERRLHCNQMQLENSTLPSITFKLISIELPLEQTGEETGMKFKVILLIK